jgi:predicted transcriptional regulator
LLELDSKIGGFAKMVQKTESPAADSDELMRSACRIIAAYVSKNPISASEVPEMIKSIYGTLSVLSGGGQGESPPTNQKLAVPIKKSITPDFIICLEDGKKLKMLKRYLRTRYKMTPDEYRAKWNLPLDYPIVAPNYSTRRSEFAKKIGLGRRKPAPKRRRR